jgi:hypothetical protein
MPAKEEKLIIGNKEEIQEYLRVKYNIQDRTDFNHPDNCWLDNMNFNQQINNFGNGFGFGCIFWVHKTSEQVEQNDMPTIELRLEKINVWLRDSELTKEQEIELINMLKNARSFSGKNILSYINIED